MSVSGKNVCGWTVEAGTNRVPNENMNIIVDRSQMSGFHGRKTLRVSFPDTFPVSIIEDLVERRGFNQVLKAARLHTEG